MSLPTMTAPNRFTLNEETGEFSFVIDGETFTPTKSKFMPPTKCCEIEDKKIVGNHKTGSFYNRDKNSKAFNWIESVIDNRSLSKSMRENKLQFFQVETHNLLEGKLKMLNSKIMKDQRFLVIVKMVKMNCLNEDGSPKETMADFIDKIIKNQGGYEEDGGEWNKDDLGNLLSYVFCGVDFSQQIRKNNLHIGFIRSYLKSVKYAIAKNTHKARKHYELGKEKSQEFFEDICAYANDPEIKLCVSESNMKDNECSMKGNEMVMNEMGCMVQQLKRMVEICMKPVPV
jgi:hypothetical protein